MSEFDRGVLRTLRVFGPCSNAEVARRMGEGSSRTYRALRRLTEAGLAAHPKLQAWDVSDAGRRLFSRMPHKPLELFS